MIEAKQKQAIL